MSSGKQQWPDATQPTYTGSLQGVEILHELTPEHLQQLHVMFQNEWWTKGRHLHDIERSLQNSYIVGLQLRKTGELIAFGRCISDQVYKAVAQDIMVREEYRGQKLGEWLVQLLMVHPALRDVQHWELYTKIPAMYSRLDFQDMAGKLHFMRKYAPHAQLVL